MWGGREILFKKKNWSLFHLEPWIWFLCILPLLVLIEFFPKFSAPYGCNLNKPMCSFTQDSTQGGIDELNWTREPGTLSSDEEHLVNHTGNVTAAAIKSNIYFLLILRYILWKDISAKKSFLFNYASARPHCEIILRCQSSSVLSSDLLGI